MSHANPILDALDSGAIVLTANQRAARSLRRQWDESRLEAGELIWQTAAVFTWKDWRREQWGDLLAGGGDDRLLMTALQEHSLWQQIIREMQGRAAQLRALADPLENTQSLALEAAEANSLLDSYCAAEAFSRYPGNGSVDAFRRWRQAFVDRCGKLRLLPESSLENVLATAISAGRISAATKKILLVGFDHFTPAQSQLLAALQSAGCATDVIQHGASAGDARQMECASLECANPREELRAAALWARKQLRQRPDARIAVILLNGDARRAEADRIFRRVLAPQQLDIGSRQPLPYEFSLGVSISRHPMTAAALALLRWCVRPLPVEDAAALLRSPWVASSPTDQQVQLQFEMKQLRRSKKLLPEVSLDEVLRLAQRNGSTSHFAGLDALRKSLVQPLGALRTHSEWAALIHAALHAAGWPGETSLDSSEYQLFERWKLLLDEFARLDFQTARITLEAAVAELQFAADQTLFAPESQDAPVQILGVLEAAGSELDAIWFAGATALAWPQPGETHPLLPWSLQRDLTMPHGDADADYALAFAMQRRILASAPMVIFSYYHEDADGMQLPSPLLQEFAPGDFSTSEETLPPLFPEHTLPVEQVDAVGALPSPPDGLLSGGADLLKTQSLCPFRAFAEHRLHAAPPEPVEFGIDARDSGNVVHKILQYFWTEVRTHAALIALSRKSREETLRAFASVELHNIIQPVSALEKAALSVQLDTLLPLLLDWLELEAARPAFTVIHTEQPIANAQIGPLQLRLRCDRIDAVDDGTVLIDYKTGYCTPADWVCPRPNEPQLPLYAVAGEPENLSAIAFARIRPGELGLAGLQNRAGILKNIILNKDGSLAATNKVIDINQRVAEWRDELTKLANNFHHGVPTVDPKKSDTCKFCDQAMLCRIAELNPLEDDEDTEGEGADE